MGTPRAGGWGGKEWSDMVYEIRATFLCRFTCKRVHHMECSLGRFNRGPELGCDCEGFGIRCRVSLRSASMC